LDQAVSPDPSVDPIVIRDTGVPSVDSIVIRDQSTVLIRPHNDTKVPSVDPIVIRDKVLRRATTPSRKSRCTSGGTSHQTKTLCRQMPGHSLRVA
jgi:hypothetical protein